MNWVSAIFFGICVGVILTVFKRGADPLSPARVFGFTWSLAIGLAELKLSGFQEEWSAESWILLLAGVGSVLVGLFIAYTLNMRRTLIPVATMRSLVKKEQVNESRLFWLICLSAAVYCLSYLAHYLIRGWLPVFVVGSKLSRVDFNVYGLTLLLFSAAFIVFFTVVYSLFVKGRKGRKAILIASTVVVVGSYFLLLQRFQIIMAAVMCFTLLYYATWHVRPRLIAPFFLAIGGFFYWISSLRFTTVAATFLYTTSKMKFSRDLAILTEPYMYVVMNLENFARAVKQLDFHTYGYFTFDFIAAITGLKYWLVDYLNLDRTPYLISAYNTYSAFWWFYFDFGVFGVTLIPLILGVAAGLLYYRMRSTPTIRNVTAYGVTLFVLLISFFVFPVMYLWFVYNLLALYLILRWTVRLPKNITQVSPEALA